MGYTQKNEWSSPISNSQVERGQQDFSVSCSNILLGAQEKYKITSVHAPVEIWLKYRKTKIILILSQLRKLDPRLTYQNCFGRRFTFCLWKRPNTDFSLPQF